MTAPIAAEDLEPAVAPLGEARGLPGTAYTHPAVLAWDLEHLFARSWVCVGRSQDVRAPGDQRAVAAGPESVLLVRGEDGRLRAFANVCRHRGHELLGVGEAVAAARGVMCPYHGWVYDLDGNRRGDGSDCALAAVRADEWHGWRFVNVSGDAAPLREHIGDLDALVAPYNPARLRAAAECEYVVGANWKLVHENYHECYHCAQIHPQLCAISPPTSSANVEPHGAWAGGFMALADGVETMSRDGRSPAGPLPDLTGPARRRVGYFGVLPNLLVATHPDYVLTHRLEPLAAGLTRIHCQWLFASDVVARDAFDPAGVVEFWDETNRQDWAAIESVQRGVSSRHFSPGRLTVREDAVHDFVRDIAHRYLAVDP